MSLAADRPEFAPPPQRGTPRAIVFALLAHVVLIAALTWGVHWKRDAEDDAVEAEIWSTTVQRAAQRLSQPPAPTPAPVTPPPPPPPPALAPRPAPPPPPPTPAVRAADPTPAPRAPDIALEREKKAREQKERELEQARQDKKVETARRAAQEKKELEARQRAEEQAQDRKEAQQKVVADARRKKEAEQKQAEAKQAEAKQAQVEAAKKKEADAKQAQAEAAKKTAAAEAGKQAAADRAATLKRMQGLAGASGDDGATGNALKSSGPSGSYGAKVAAAVRPNVVFPDADLVDGNPKAEFEVKLAPDGTIVGVRLVKSSGLPNWDQAAERGLRKTDKLPRDNDGRTFPSLVVALQPKR
ncbi:MAG: cell envelope integrity protein TolA [Janthinobacterium lividum]